MEQLHIITRLDPRDAFLVDESSLLSPIVKRERTFITMISPPSVHASTKHDPTRQVIQKLRRNQSNRMGSSRLYDVWSHPMQSSSIPRFVSPRTTHKRSWHASVSPSTKSNSPNHGTTATTCIHTRTLNAHSQEHGHGGVRNSSWHSSKVTKSMKYETWHFETQSFQRVYQHSY